MRRSLPEMGNWDSAFEETYLRTYVPFAATDGTAS
jgi:hypothetical protein